MKRILSIALLLGGLLMAACDNEPYAKGWKPNASNSNVESFITCKTVNATRVAAVVFGRLQGKVSASSYGICISLNENPTIDDTKVAADNRCSDEGFEGYFGAYFKGLTPSTTYHARAYFTDQTGKTIYGEDVTFKTTTGGTFSWDWADGSEALAKSAGAYDRITEAMDSACSNFIHYTNLSKHFTVEYTESESVPTADCSVKSSEEAYMRFGKESIYQWVGTAQHELTHGMGVGQSDNWTSFPSPWEGTWTVLTARVMLQDVTININHDNMHFWPGGINYRNNVESLSGGDADTKKDAPTSLQERRLQANCLIINSMREVDGLHDHW